MSSQKINIPAQEKACLAEIEKVLNNYGCQIKVQFRSESVMGNDVLVYIPTIVHKDNREG